MVTNYHEFASWVWSLPQGDRVLLDHFPITSTGMEATPDRIRKWCWNINEIAKRPALNLITPSPESGGRWVLRRYEGWMDAVEHAMSSTGKSQRRAWLDQFPTLTPEGIPVAADRVQYARLVASDWNRRHEDKVSVVTRDGTAYLVPQTEAVNGRALKEAAMRDGWAEGTGRGLKSDKDVVVRVYPGNTVAYFRRDELMVVRIASYEAKRAGVDVVSVLDAARSIY